MLRVDAAEAMRQALDAGVRFIQYRSKNEARKSLFETSLNLARMAGRCGAFFIVNDHADIAAAVGAAGVHVGQDDLPVEAARLVLGAGSIIGVSTHNLEQARMAQNAGADYIGFGPVFATTTKDAGSVQGLASLKQVRMHITIPVVAIGGITLDNVQAIVKTGTSGVAVISAIMLADSIRTASKSFLSLITEAGG